MAREVHNFGGTKATRAVDKQFVCVPTIQYPHYYIILHYPYNARISTFEIF